MIKKWICIILPFLKMCNNNIEEEKPKHFELDGERLVTSKEIKLLEEINKYREEHGIEPLLFKQELYNVARLRNIRNIDLGEISHDWLYYDVEQIFGTTTIPIQENLAEGYSYPKSALNAWIKSIEGHNEVLLDGSYAGIAIDNKYYTLIIR